jgi:hypothetical protein
MYELNNFSSKTPGVLGMNYDQRRKGESQRRYRSNIEIRASRLAVEGKQRHLTLNEHSVYAIQTRLD